MEGVRAGRRCPGWRETTSLLTYCGAAPTLRISAWGSWGGRGPLLSEGPA